MIQITEKNKCSGCSACAQACPKRCIKMVADSEGFLYPSVDESICINCDKCVQVCPISNTFFNPKSEYPKGYLLYANDKNIREKSAAGGGFMAIAQNFIKQYNGVVFGAVYDSDFCVKHVSTETLSGLKKMQKSKYVQSDISNTYTEVTKLLQEGRYVLFSGTPCQIYGLKSYLGKYSNDDRLYSVDLSCHGVPSPKVFKTYLEALEKQEHSKIKSFTMRDKRLGKKSYKQGFGIEFESGVHRFYSHSEDLFGRCFWGEIASRPSCYDCHFKTIWRASDITLGDCWFFESFVPEEKDTLGVTMALAHTSKGVGIIDDSDNITKYCLNADKLIKANGGMIYSSAVEHARRDEFFSRLEKEPFDKLVNEIIPRKTDSYKQKILKLLERLGLRLNFIRKKSRMNRLKLRLRNDIPPSALGEMKFKE